MLNENDSEISLTFAKGLAVLQAFDGAHRAMTVSEIARRTGQNRAVARRLVRTLEQLGFVTADRGRFELTPRVLRLIQGFIEGRGISQIIQPILRRTAVEIGECVSFSMQDGAEAVYVAHSFVPTKFTLNMVTVGSRVPLAPTAVGRALLAHLPAAEGLALLAPPLAAHTARTETDPERLRERLAAVRRTGHAFVEGEYMDGISSLALPVLGPGQKPAGALSIIFPTGQYTEAGLADSIIPRLRQCAADIGAAF
jgi:IclR family pca regulon transcriptional regulator